MSTLSIAETALSLGPRVVIVEDEPDIADVLQLTLQRHHFHITMLNNGFFDAFMVACPQEPDLVVCDMNLPGGSGTALCAMVVEKYPNCGVILMTGGADSEMEAPEIGGTQKPILLHKPFSLAKFAEIAMTMTAKSQDHGSSDDPTEEVGWKRKQSC